MKKFISEFKEFIARGDVMSMAVGIIIGGAFTSIVNSLVNDVISPLLGIILGGIDFTGIMISVGPDGREFHPGSNNIPPHSAGHLLYNEDFQFIQAQG